MSRVLVLGATGYVGSRLVPALLAAGHDVVASSSRAPDPSAYEWGQQVEWRRCDATDADQVARALEGIDALCYLVHSLDAPAFAERDRRAARTTAEAVAGSDVRRVVYLSGLVPEATGRRPLSDHLASRQEVEGLLATSGRPTLALRAGVVIGAGSTSFEIVRQLATLLVVQPVPWWMRSRVQPVAVSDVVRALVEQVGLTEPGQPVGSLDVGGPDVLRYPDLLGLVARCAGLVRVRVPVPTAPSTAVGLGMAALSAAPPRTALALAHSLRDDMVCRAGRTWVPADNEPLLDAETAVRRALGDDPEHPETARRGDADWTRDVPFVDLVPSPASVRAAGALAVRRLREGVDRARRVLDEADRARPPA